MHSALHQVWFDMSDYPPTAIAAQCQSLPEWIKLGVGSDEYICEEKGALFDPLKYFHTNTRCPIIQ